MNRDFDRLKRLNCLVNETDLLYHQAARKLGVSDSVMCILYVIYEKGNDCLLCDVCIESRLSKQTINSALRKLEGDGILYLKQDKGKNKRIHLTEKGREYTTYTAARLYEAERNALSDWTEEELSTYMRLMKKYNDCLRTQFDDIY